MDVEMENHNQNGSFEWMRRADVPKGRHLIKLVWVFKTKRNGKLKSRLCVQGCAQTAGIDFDQTFSAALRSTSLRFIASVAARENLRLRRWDFVSAYLQGQLEEGEVVYCSAPPGYERKDTEGFEMCCKVVKPIYGMAQAGRRWQRSLFPWLVNLGFKQSESDPCLFHKQRGEDRLIVGVYVDDLACAFSSDAPGSLYSEFVSSLAEWNVEDEGDLADLLGVDFSVSDSRVSLKQTNYIDKLFAEYAPATSSAPSCHLPYGAELPQAVVDALVQDASDIDPALLKRYQSLVGALLYCATNTRPDIAYSVALLCRAMGKPTPELYVAAERVLRYLHRTRDLGLTYDASPRDLHGYTDSDWAVKHSTSGWVFVMNQAAISWGSRKQKSVALSSCEAEIVAASEASTEAVHLDRLAREFGQMSDKPLSLSTDNKAAQDVAYNPEHHTRMKHVERRHFFVRELVEEHKLRVPYVSTDDNLADFFTKALPASKFFPLRDKIMNVSPVPRVHGGALRGDLPKSGPKRLYVRGA
jgi:hypothetical protein